MHKQLDRRDFIKTATVSLAALAAGSLWSRAAVAQEKLSPADPMAQSLKYVEDAAKLDPKTPGFQVGRICGSCMLYGTASEKDGFAPCAAFGGKLVAHKGWCAAWTAKG